MNIEKAIEIEEEATENIERIGDVFDRYGDPDHAEVCKKNAAAHREIATWLRELQEIIGY